MSYLIPPGAQVCKWTYTSTVICPPVGEPYWSTPTAVKLFNPCTSCALEVKEWTITSAVQTCEAEKIVCDPACDPACCPDPPSIDPPTLTIPSECCPSDYKCLYYCEAVWDCVSGLWGDTTYTLQSCEEDCGGTSPGPEYSWSLENTVNACTLYRYYCADDCDTIVDCPSTPTTPTAPTGDPPPGCTTCCADTAEWDAFGPEVSDPANGYYYGTTPDSQTFDLSAVASCGQEGTLTYTLMIQSPLCDCTSSYSGIIEVYGDGTYWCGTGFDYASISSNCGDLESTSHCTSSVTPSSGSYYFSASNGGYLPGNAYIDVFGTGTPCKYKLQISASNSGTAPADCCGSISCAGSLIDLGELDYTSDPTPPDTDCIYVTAEICTENFVVGGCGQEVDFSAATVTCSSSNCSGVVISGVTFGTNPVTVGFWACNLVRCQTYTFDVGPIKTAMSDSACPCPCDVQSESVQIRLKVSADPASFNSWDCTGTSYTCSSMGQQGTYDGNGISGSGIGTFALPDDTRTMNYHFAFLGCSPTQIEYRITKGSGSPCANLTTTGWTTLGSTSTWYWTSSSSVVQGSGYCNISVEVRWKNGTAPQGPYQIKGKFYGTAGV